MPASPGALPWRWRPCRSSLSSRATPQRFVVDPEGQLGPEGFLFLFFKGAASSQAAGTGFLFQYAVGFGAKVNTFLDR
ncbi:hypothetical protein [Streptomyces violarus]|uniref:hypothetical protein n=1 Tax=Streptomyces violarus TaxID=67380 RepID=UPI0021BE2E82|nr:hypothetical protein [Streptomyces violarus]MCT9138578.1 hypothetical protein [Streptomyces violarus]